MENTALVAEVNCVDQLRKRLLDERGPLVEDLLFCNGRKKVPAQAEIKDDVCIEGIAEKLVEGDDVWMVGDSLVEGELAALEYVSPGAGEGLVETLDGKVCLSTRALVVESAIDFAISTGAEFLEQVVATMIERATREAGHKFCSRKTTHGQDES